jgi:hypothetical protein
MTALWMVGAGLIALWIMSGPKRVVPPPGSRWSIDLRATNIARAELEADMRASTAAKGNKLLSFKQTGADTYHLVIEYGPKGDSVIWVERPVHTPGNVVLTTIDARKM